MKPLRRRWFVALPILGVPALPIPAGALSLSYKCFFDTGSDAISPRCERTLSYYVDLWTRARDGRWPLPGPNAGFAPPYTITRVEVGGHTDGAEASQGLVILGERRARAVGEWLIAEGIPRDYVVTAGYGANRLLVPTQPHETELQNRRVEIISR